MVPARVVLVGAVLLVVGAASYVLAHQRSGPDTVAITEVPPGPARPEVLPGASTGVYTQNCGRNDNGHRNADNLVASAGQPGAAHHLHEYVGNLSTDAASTDASLAAAGTTCPSGDLSTYYWPVLRGADHHAGPRPPAEVTVTFTGNPTGPVLPMPRFLRASTGDAHGATDGGALARPAFGCVGFPGRRTFRYVDCPPGHDLLRVYDFPSCWDGRRTDSADHRAHLVFPAANGACPAAMFAVPALHLTVRYPRPDGPYAIDTFPDQGASGLADHADFVDVLPDELTAAVVTCVNAGKNCP